MPKSHILKKKNAPKLDKLCGFSKCQNTFSILVLEFQPEPIKKWWFLKFQKNWKSLHPTVYICTFHEVTVNIAKNTFYNCIFLEATVQIARRTVYICTFNELTVYIIILFTSVFSLC